MGHCLSQHTTSRNPHFPPSPGTTKSHWCSARVKEVINSKQSRTPKHKGTTKACMRVTVDCSKQGRALTFLSRVITINGEKQLAQPQETHTFQPSAPRRAPSRSHAITVPTKVPMHANKKASKPSVAPPSNLLSTLKS